MIVSPVCHKRVFDIGICRLQFLVCRQGNGRPGIDLAIKMCVYPNLVETVGFRVEFVKGRFVGYPQQDQDAAGDAYGKSRDIDYGVKSVPEEVSEGDEQVVLEHSLGRFAYGILP